MEPKDMNITSLSDALVVFRGDSAMVDLFTPNLAFDGRYELGKYVVQPGQAGRMDLIMDDIYDTTNYSLYSDIDVILYINNIDNPLSVRPGMEILYPTRDNLESFRYTPNQDSNDSFESDIVSRKLMYPNKTTNVDPARKKFLEEVSVPPTVNASPRPPVVVDEGKIIIGGI